ncbi:MAG: hypothetical protein AB4426_06915 [Xenococcaceae cyanobacterium]
MSQFQSSASSTEEFRSLCCKNLGEQTNREPSPIFYTVRSPTRLRLATTGYPAECGRFARFRRRDWRWGVILNSGMLQNRVTLRRGHMGEHGTASIQLNPDIGGAFLDSTAHHLFAAAPPYGK